MERQPEFKKYTVLIGNFGSGKTELALNMVLQAAKKGSAMLVDMDIQNAAIDIYNNLSNSTNSLQYLMEEIDRDSFNQEVLLDLTNKSNKNGKLSFITNNMGIYECQNKLSEEYYAKLYSESENEYDVLILDMPSAPFLDVVPYSLTKADRIFFVVNPNFISMRQATKYLDLLKNIWKIPKENGICLL